MSTASSRARGRPADLDRDALRRSFDTKVIGPLVLAKHLAPRMPAGGSFVIFSGVAAAKIAVEGKAEYFADIAGRNPARRIGTTEDIATGVLFAMTNTFLTGQTLHIDGGELLT